VIEKAIAIEDLKADIDTSWVKGKPYIDTMVASLEVEDPNNSEVLDYKTAMQKNWGDEGISEVYYDSDKELILFRKGLLLNDTKRNDIYNVLLSLPPNNFKSLLIRVMLLKIAGYSKESAAMARQITKALSISSSTSKQWYKLVPDSLIRFKNINPFVLYPFFIYYGGDSFN
jgi:hypothetical protein